MRVQRETSGARDLEDAVGAGAHRVDDPLRDALAVEAGELLDQVVVLAQRGPGGARGPGVLVVDDRRAGLGGQREPLGHDRPPH